MPETTGSKGSLLIVSPAFHGYCYSIAAGFEQLGYRTRVHRYDAFDTVADKARNKLLFELPAKFGADSRERSEAHLTDKALQALRETRPDKLIVIKGDMLGQAFWDEVEAQKVPTILWLYDDLKRHRYTLDFLRERPTVLSYAASEARGLLDQGVNAHYVPNAYDPELAKEPVTRTDEIVFVGSRYENRTELLTYLHAHGVPVRAYGRQWSHHWWDRVRTWELARPDIPAERDIPLQEAYAVQAGAAAALNVHGLQAGLAMRTFEVPGMRGIQLIDRPDVEEFYEPGTEVLIYRTPEELLELSQRLIADPSWAEDIREAGQKRTLAEHTFAHRARKIDALWA